VEKNWRRRGFWLAAAMKKVVGEVEEVVVAKVRMRVL